MNLELLKALEQIGKEKGISKDTLLEAVKSAMETAYKKEFDSKKNVEIDINEASGEFHVYSKREVVDEVENENLEISLAEARKYNVSSQLGDEIKVEVTPANFGRIAAQNAKQVITQNIKEAEREIVYNEYVNQVGDIISAQVQGYNNNNIIIDIGRTEAILTPQEQIPQEHYEPGSNIQVYLVDVKETTKEPEILLSRTHPGLLKRLFEKEVPEIYDGTVEIKSVAREAGFRSKIAVASRDENVDAVGACVGPNGSRVRAIVDQLNGEKIDIVEWDEDIKVFISNALSPAEVVEVIPDDTEDVAEVIVPDYQLSLAIGKEGQNARLSAKLTDWKIDIKSESQAKEE